MTDFDGFPRKTLTFLRGIARHNSKDWFDEHRADYERYWLEPARAFVVAAGAALQSVAPVTAEPRVNGSIFRVNRDVRFAKDKRPYKDHLDFWFWEGERKAAVSGFYLRIAPKALGIGAGAHGFDKERLTAFRDAVVDPAAGRALATAAGKVEKGGHGVHGEQYKRIPRGYEPGNETQQRFLRYGALWTGDDEPHPPELHSAAIVPYVVQHWKEHAPIHRWLVDHVE